MAIPAVQRKKVAGCGSTSPTGACPALIPADATAVITIVTSNTSVVFFTVFPPYNNRCSSAPNRLSRRVLFESVTQVGIFPSRRFQVKDQVLDPQPQVVQRLLEIG